MAKWQRILAVSALTVFMAVGVAAVQPTQTTAQAAMTKAQKKAKAKKAKTKKLRQEKKHFTASQWSQITKYRKQAKKIGTSSKGMYAQKPSVKKNFRPGKLSKSYINRTVNWVNFYRSMFGLNKVTADSAWNTSAQMGAATLAAADKGLSHGLVGFKRPAVVSKQDWQAGADATNQSNLYKGASSPYDMITGYLSDDCDLSGLEPGHRMWLLGGTDKIGVGQANGYNDLRVFSDGHYNDHAAVKTVAYPRAGLMPYALVGQGAPWSVSFADDYSGDGNTKLVVHVYDKTAKKKVPVSQVSVTSGGYGYFGTNVYFLPKKSLIKVNHAYTVKISGIEDQPDISYQTRLFDLTVNGEFY